MAVRATAAGPWVVRDELEEDPDRRRSREAFAGRLSRKRGLMRRAAPVIASLGMSGLLVWLVCFAQKPTGKPALGTKWHEQVYGLDEGEVLRLIVPPYPPTRNFGLARQWHGNVPPGFKEQLVLHKNKGVTESFAMAVGPATIGSDIRWCTGVRGPRMEMVGAVEYWNISGDWFVKSDESVERRMAALQSIIRSYSRKEIVLEQRMLEREVVVVSGDWNFKQLEVGPYISITGAVALYDSDNDLNRIGSSGKGSLKDLFEILKSWLMLRVVDEVKGEGRQDAACERLCV